MMQALSIFLKPFGFDLFCLGKKFLVFNLVSRNLKIKYRRSVFGVFWTLLSPLLMAGVYFGVFSVVMRVRVDNYPLFILAGILPWTFFAQTVSEGLESLVGNWGLLSKIPVPLQVFPYVGTLTNFVTLTLSLPVFLLLAALLGRLPGAQLVLLPFYGLCLFLITYSACLLAGVAFVYFRDLRHLLGILLQVGFYATPVIYDESMIPQKLRFLLVLNPMATVISGFHDILVRSQWPSAVHMSALIVWSFVGLALCAFIQRRTFPVIVERI